MITELLKALELAGVGLKAFEEIALVVQGDDHSKIVDAIRKIVDVVVLGLHGNMDKDSILAELAKLKSEIAANDAAAQSAIDKKFG
jgi:hypothetical protein